MPTNAPEKEVEERTRSVAARSDVMAWIERFNALIAEQPEGVRVFVTGEGGPLVYSTDESGEGYYIERRRGMEENDRRSLIVSLDMPPAGRHPWDGGAGC